MENRTIKKIEGTQDYEKIAKQIVYNYYTERGIEISIENIYVIWMCKTLENIKGILSTTIPDKKMYEITYNGQKNELYFDPYLQTDNIVIKNFQDML